MGAWARRCGTRRRTPPISSATHSSSSIHTHHLPLRPTSLHLHPLPLTKMPDIDPLHITTGGTNLNDEQKAAFLLKL